MNEKSKSSFGTVTILIKASEKYFHCYTVLGSSDSSVAFNSKLAVNFKVSVAIQVKATEQYFPMVLFIMLYKVVLTFESVDEILKCDHSNKSYLAVLFLWYCLLCCTRWL